MRKDAQGGARVGESRVKRGGYTQRRQAVMSRSSARAVTLHHLADDVLGDQFNHNIIKESNAGGPGAIAAQQLTGYSNG